MSLPEHIQQAFDAKFTEIGEDVWHDIGNDKIFEFGWQAAMAFMADQMTDTTENKKVWCEYIATMIGAYLNEPVDSAKCKAIAGIIERRLWSFPQQSKVTVGQGDRIVAEVIKADRQTRLASQDWRKP